MLGLLIISVILTATQAVEFQIVNKEVGAVWIGIQGNNGKEHLANGGFILEAGQSMLAPVIISIILAAAKAAEFQFANNEMGTIWVGILEKTGHERLANGGFILEPGEMASVQAPEDWAGRFWGRTWCDPSNNFCLTGDCGMRLECGGNGGAPPASLAEITLKGADGLDFYDLSLVDGFNLAISFEPVGGSGDGGEYSCKKASCERHLNDECPAELQLGSDHGVVGCKSACLAFNTDQYCCRNAFGTPDTCKSSDWPVNYPEFFKSRCPDAYSYAYDDRKSTFTCRAEKYLVTFGI